MTAQQRSFIEALLRLRRVFQFLFRSLYPRQLFTAFFVNTPTNIFNASINYLNNFTNYIGVVLNVRNNIKNIQLLQNIDLILFEFRYSILPHIRQHWFNYVSIMQAFLSLLVILVPLYIYVTYYCLCTCTSAEFTALDLAASPMQIKVAMENILFDLFGAESGSDFTTYSPGSVGSDNSRRSFGSNSTFNKPVVQIESREVSLQRHQQWLERLAVFTQGFHDFLETTSIEDSGSQAPSSVFSANAPTSSTSHIQWHLPNTPVNSPYQPGIVNQGYIYHTFSRPCQHIPFGDTGASYNVDSVDKNSRPL